MIRTLTLVLLLAAPGAAFSQGALAPTPSTFAGKHIAEIINRLPGRSVSMSLEQLGS